MSQRPPAADAGSVRERHQETGARLNKLSLVSRGLTILLIVVFAVSLWAGVSRNCLFGWGADQLFQGPGYGGSGLSGRFRRA